MTLGTGHGEVRIGIAATSLSCKPRLRDWPSSYFKWSRSEAVLRSWRDEGGRLPRRAPQISNVLSVIRSRTTRLARAMQRAKR